MQSLNRQYKQKNNIKNLKINYNFAIFVKKWFQNRFFLNKCQIAIKRGIVVKSMTIEISNFLRLNYAKSAIISPCPLWYQNSPHCSPSPPLSCCSWITNKKRGGREKLSAHSLWVPPAPTTIIYLLGPNPSSQIFTGCWFHSVTVTIWTLHGGLISCARPIRKLTGSCTGQSWKPAPDVHSYCQALLTWNDVFI